MSILCEHFILFYLLKSYCQYYWSLLDPWFTFLSLHHTLIISSHSPRDSLIICALDLLSLCATASPSRIQSVHILLKVRQFSLNHCTFEMLNSLLSSLYLFNSYVFLSFLSCEYARIFWASSTCLLEIQTNIFFQCLQLICLRLVCALLYVRFTCFLLFKWAHAK